MPTASLSTRSRHDALVEFNRPVCDEHFMLRLRLSSPLPPTLPGQFIQLGCRPPSDSLDLDSFRGNEIDWSPTHPPRPAQPELCHPLALLRRPFSLAGRGDDDSRGSWIDILHRVVGVGTDWLARLAPNDPVDFIGPLGNSFTLPPNKSLALLVGGGVGIPPMFYLASALQSAGYTGYAFVGALSKNLLAVSLNPAIIPDPAGNPTLCVDEFSTHQIPASITTDDGSLGLKGRITAALDLTLTRLSPADRARAIVYVCGPNPMMHAVAHLAASHAVDCQVCLEQAMACGMGTCQSCIIKLDPSLRMPTEKPHGQTPEGRPWRFKLACTDGPVFPASHVVW